MINISLTFESLVVLSTTKHLCVFPSTFTPRSPAVKNIVNKHIDVGFQMKTCFQRPFLVCHMGEPHDLTRVQNQMCINCTSA